MKYIIIGLGNYGHVLAEELSALGHEIIGADISESRVDSIKDKVATAFVIDATDEQSLSVLPLNSVDIVVVAIGENFGASVRVVALLKQKKVPRIFARAIDEVNVQVMMERMGGGGHLNIAGAQVKATEDETEKMIKDIIDQLYQEGEFKE